MNKLEKDIAKIACEIQGFVDSEFSKCFGVPEPDSSLDQAGLRDGESIVLDYLRHGEAGVALEHILYTIRETGINIPNETRDNLGVLAASLHIELNI